MTALSSEGQSTPAGEGWWQASDGNWYPPEATPARPAKTGTNGKARVALLLGIFGFIGIFASAPAIALGFVARSEISKSEGRQTGTGMATAGIVLGCLWLIAAVVVVALFWNQLTTPS